MNYTSICAMICIVGAYAIYAFSNPGTDGALFGTVMLIVGALAGLKIKEMQDDGTDRLR
ncbi:unnamed protein product [marine sediment metagenome]|uniref:Uncharacterized protein n=1 Tax=marine sediment metagenome TaxID=412755 RepID=X1SMY2_9ZZZZ